MLKVHLYVLSLALLFVFFIILNIKVPFCLTEGCNFIGFKKLANDNVISIISIFVVLWSVYGYQSFKYAIKGASEIPFKIKKIESANYEHLTFLATYVIPLISFDFSKERQIIVLLLLLIIMGIIYIKTDLFYANPSLALLGFHIYKADGEFKPSIGTRENIILITRAQLIAETRVKYIKLDDRIFYVQKAD
ncbi:anti-phage protein KwaA [Acinetobacter sp. WCHAc060025]|uniref:anti-phage protein KwaA n=1 Tax=Acinetobacter sp. WCHAc060025 TaxID=2518625 RepID=UPI001023A91E|nr:anti-phage protein KwaA [Acinetobacter sp. WCHAc060025]RZG77133.1 hypothetical protein EXE09_04325 [Acinetobacter sp. WCHAc060025]